MIACLLNNKTEREDDMAESVTLCIGSATSDKE
jgi:hypothetical protein